VSAQRVAERKRREKILNQKKKDQRARGDCVPTHVLHRTAMDASAYSGAVANDLRKEGGEKRTIEKKKATLEPSEMTILVARCLGGGGKRREKKSHGKRKGGERDLQSWSLTISAHPARSRAKKKKKGDQSKKKKKESQAARTDAVASSTRCSFVAAHPDGKKEKSLKKEERRHHRRMGTVDLTLDHRDAHAYKKVGRKKERRG